MNEKLLPPSKSSSSSNNNNSAHDGSSSGGSGSPPWKDATCFSLDYYRQFFDIDTEQVVFRIRSSFWQADHPSDNIDHQKKATAYHYDRVHTGGGKHRCVAQTSERRSGCNQSAPSQDKSAGLPSSSLEYVVLC